MDSRGIFILSFRFSYLYSIVRHHDSILSATKQEYSERITLLNEKTAEYKERYEEYEGMVRLLQEDKCALSEALNARDDKLMQNEELQLSILALRKEVESKNDLEHELVSCQDSKTP